MKTLSSSLLIAGKSIPGNGTGEWIVRNKFTGAEMVKIPLASAAQIEEAISRAKEAFKKERKVSAGERSERLKRLVKIVERERQSLATLISEEAGKPISYARAEVDRCIATLGFAAEEARRLGGEVVPMDFSNGAGRPAFTQRFAMGPILAISPFNFPLNLALHKLAPALAIGASIILKPSPYAPLSLLAFARFFEEAQIPAGLVSVVACDNELAEKMVRDPRLKILSFTGSPGVGWKLKEIAGKKKVILELGGNAAVVVDESSDLQVASSLIATGAYLYSGQICISTQRIFVVETVYDRFKTLLVEKIAKLKVGDPSDEQVVVGPLIDRIHLERIEAWVNEAVSSGATILCGGKVVNREQNLYAPTLIEGAARDCKVVAEEVFGPLAVIEKVKSFEDALTLVNDSRFGLQCGVFTNYVDRMKEAYRSLNVGAVIMNNVPGFRLDHMPYGGVKDSGLGREGVRYAIEEMTEPRLLVF
jgi:glyceraldehyde-3-phosphate dehydrogenase (NADP+)